MTEDLQELLFALCAAPGMPGDDSEAARRAAWELSDWTVGAILKLRVGELPNPEQPVAGDVNGDKSVTVDDAILVLRHIAGLETLSDSALTAAEMNGDGSVDVNDAIAILSKIAGAN